MSHKLLLLFLLGFVALALSAPIVEEELSPAAQDETKDEPQLEDQANQLEQVDDSEPEETEEAESEEVSEYETGSDEDANEVVQAENDDESDPEKRRCYEACVWRRVQRWYCFKQMGRTVCRRIYKYVCVGKTLKCV
ncbi:predicted protein [Nematostella vectensis]|uniref:Uncharacterized protein n=1 Tax=Nematostella vectensis TaxID=45351 RepID=A7T626_NEMVE|nr:predicted protein [Nematostella vectensis]|eukprot:XP_001620681.1 hypothetical protein NEMVEDRAFT_v1g248768 [Nematostella vectensis]